ncbi:MAG: dihydrodipicolinate synthase family protein [Verrucomicrobia bacterium]|nr:dihydrodipicolinate synthase family protein [Verrucomicrobiota bacterium]
MSRRIKSLTRKNLHGVWCALIVPWNERDELDARRFAREVRGYGGTGVHGVYTGGTTGEFYAQDDATFDRITAIACDEAHDLGLPVQIGASALSTRTARQRIRTAVRRGADAIQIALPFWLELKDDELRRFVREIAAEAGRTPIVLYLTMRSKRKIEPRLLAEIAHEVPTFIGTKDTGSDVKAVKAMLKVAPDLAIFGGEDFYERIPAGGRGGYCSITGFNAPKVVELYELCAAGRLREAKPLAEAMRRYLHEALIPLVREEGLWDSAVDRIQRVAGGGVVGVRCQSPYRSGTEQHVKRLIAWVRRHTPELLPAHLA